MKKSSVVKLQTIALSIHMAALVLTLLVMGFQNPLKELARVPRDLCEVFAVPIDHLLNVGLLLIVYVAAWWIFRKTQPKETVVKAVVLLVVTCVFGILLSLSSTYIVRLIAMEGENLLASYGALNSILARVVTPVQNIAYILFCVACGGYMGCREEK